MQSNSILSPSVKHLPNFEVFEAVKTTELSGYFSHAVNKVRKSPSGILDLSPAKYQYVWYCKPVKVLNEAFIEVVSQEMLRLFNPEQPKTRVAMGDVDKYCVLSKEIPNLESLNVNTSEKISQIEAGHLTGLGAILIFCLWLNEIDLKMQHVVQSNVPDKNANNNNNSSNNTIKKLVKYDGDRSFGNLIKIGTNFNHRFDTYDLCSLPMINLYSPANWLDIIGWTLVNVDKDGKPVFCPSLNPNSLFAKLEFKKIDIIKDEVNTAILQILLMSNELIAEFIKYYVWNESNQQELNKELCARKQMLLYATLGKMDFHEFVAKLDKEKFIDTLLALFVSFKATHKTNPFLKYNPDEIKAFLLRDLKTITQMLIPKDSFTFTAKQSANTSASASTHSINPSNSLPQQSGPPSMLLPQQKHVPIVFPPSAPTPMPIIQSLGDYTLLEIFEKLRMHVTKEELANSLNVTCYKLSTHFKKYKITFAEFKKILNRDELIKKFPDQYNIKAKELFKEYKAHKLVTKKRAHPEEAKASDTLNSKQKTFHHSTLPNSFPPVTRETFSSAPSLMSNSVQASSTSGFLNNPQNNVPNPYFYLSNNNNSNNNNSNNNNSNNNNSNNNNSNNNNSNNNNSNNNNSNSNDNNNPLDFFNNIRTDTDFDLFPELEQFNASNEFHNFPVDFYETHQEAQNVDEQKFFETEKDASLINTQSSFTLFMNSQAEMPDFQDFQENTENISTPKSASF